MDTPAKTDRGLREERLGFRVDESTKALIDPPAPSDRLARAFADHERRVVR